VTRLNDRGTVQAPPEPVAEVAEVAQAGFPHRWWQGLRGTATPSDRRTFVSLALQSIVNAFVYSTYLARLPDIRDQAGISISTLGVVMTVGNLAGFVGSFFTTMVIGRLGSKWVMIWGGTLYVFALPIIGSSSSAAVLVTAIVGMMLMNVFVDVGVAMQSAQFSLRRGRTVMSRMSGFYSLGTVGGGLAASSIAAAGFDVSIHLVVLATLLAAALVFVGPGLLPVDEQPEEASRAVHPTSRWRPGRAVIVLGVASAMAVPLDIVPGEWATFRMHDDLGTSTAAAAAAYFAFAAGMAAGRLGGDWAAVRIGRTNLARLGPIMSASGLVLAATVPSRTTAFVGFLAAGLGISVLSPLLTEAAHRVPGPPGSGLRAMFVGNRLAGLLTPVAVGSLAGSAQLGVGTAMVTVVLPCTTLLVVLAAMAVRGPARPRRAGVVGRLADQPAHRPAHATAE
jgi:hypothetical protein